MRNRLLPESSEVARLLNSDPPPTFKCKVLPYLKSMNYDQPIDYRLY